MSVGEKIRTPDLLVRSQTLYPAELRPHKMPQTGIEPVREYKSRRILSPVRLPVPPLRHICFSVNYEEHTCKHCLLKLTPQQWMEKDSNLRRRCQQIYSLPPLATRESIHKADKRTRTVNLLITNQLLCQLSHIGIGFYLI